MLFQQPKVMLDPTARVGGQVAEALRRHRGVGRREAKARVVEMLRDVGIPEPARRASAFSYQLSGGMAQRVMIAAALSADPELVIADEPTTALDVTVQAQILDLLKRKRDELGLSILLITHDLGIVSTMADRVAVMYAGRIVENGTTADIFNSPQHPYTEALLKASLLEAERGQLYSIPGSVAQARAMGHGCRFLPRCPKAAELGISEHVQWRGADPAHLRRPRPQQPLLRGARARGGGMSTPVPALPVDPAAREQRVDQSMLRLDGRGQVLPGRPRQARALGGRGLAGGRQGRGARARR